MIKFNLDKILERDSISISYLSQLTGISRPSLTSISNNTSRSVNLDFLEKLMDTLGVELSELISEVSTILLADIYVKYHNSYEYYDIQIRDKDTDEIIFNNSLGLISKKQYIRETSELSESLGYGKTKQSDYDSYEQLYYLVCSPLKSLEERQTGNIDLLKLVDILGREQMNSFLVKLISEGSYLNQFDTEKLLTIGIASGSEFYFFGFSGNSIVPVPLNRTISKSELKKLPKLEISSFSRITDNHIYSVKNTSLKK